MKVVVVESPAKAKTINKYLGSDYHVLASFGHVRDLPAKDGSVDPENGFAMLWTLEDRSNKHVGEIVKAVKNADTLILATDPDREGEAISWHLLEALREKKALKNQKVQRVTFNAITKNSVLKAMANPHAAPSITLWASSSRLCCGESCLARARPDGCIRLLYVLSHSSHSLE
jgi:DNA topoisomerase I